MIAFHQFGDKRALGVLLAPLLLLASDALAQTAPDRAAGTSAAQGLTPKVQSALRDSSVAAIAAPVSPALTIANAQYASAGVALRNRTSGAIQISGIAGPVKRAYLYWAFLYRSTTPPATQSIGFCPSTATSSACSTKTGTLLATGADTCWGSSGVAVYRADVTSSVAGNGLFLVTLGAGASASNSGADPWTSVTFPAAEGASLVVVGTGAKTVSVYDRGLSGATFFGSTSYTLNVPGGVKKTPVLWDNIGADGQTGSGRLVGFGVAKEKTYINGVQIAGPGVDTTVNGVTGSDWDGGVGSPLPQLWDDTGHSLPTAAANVGASALAVRVSSAGASFDCVTPIANVISY